MATITLELTPELEQQLPDEAAAKEFNLLWQSSTSTGLGAFRKGSNRQAVAAIRPSNPKF